LGLVGVLGGNFLEAPTDQTIEVGGTHGQPMGLPYEPPFAGLTGGGGLALQARIRDYFGVELDVLRTRDQGEANFSISQAGVTRDFTLELAQSAWHMPLLLQGILPGEIASPMLLIGPEFVVCESAEANIVHGQNPYPTEFAATARSYLMVTLGLGAELKIPWAELDLRVPLSARVSVTPSVSDTRQGRALYYGADINHVSRLEHEVKWKYQVELAVGASVHF